MSPTSPGRRPSGAAPWAMCLVPAATRESSCRTMAKAPLCCSMRPVAAVLRSWEARFGARLTAVGPGGQITLLVERPPRTTEAAQAVAAEHFAFCDECAGQGLRDIPGITASLVNAPTWTFWWD